MNALFGDSDSEEEDSGRDALKYNRPKAPSREPAAEPTPPPAPQISGSGQLGGAFVLDTASGQFKPVADGILGYAFTSLPTESSLLIYTPTRQVLAQCQLDAAMVPAFQSDTYVSFVSAGTTWSLNFPDAALAAAFVRSAALLRVGGLVARAEAGDAVLSVPTSPAPPGDTAARLEDGDRAMLSFAAYALAPSTPLSLGAPVAESNRAKLVVGAGTDFIDGMSDAARGLARAQSALAFVPPRVAGGPSWTVVEFTVLKTATARRRRTSARGSEEAASEPAPAPVAPPAASTTPGRDFERAADAASAAVTGSSAVSEPALAADRDADPGVTQPVETSEAADAQASEQAAEQRGGPTDRNDEEAAALKARMARLSAASGGAGHALPRNAAQASPVSGSQPEPVPEPGTGSEPVPGPGPASDPAPQQASSALVVADGPAQAPAPAAGPGPTAPAAPTAAAVAGAAAAPALALSGAGDQAVSLLSHQLHQLQLTAGAIDSRVRDIADVLRRYPAASVADSPTVAPEQKRTSVAAGDDGVSDVGAATAPDLSAADIAAAVVALGAAHDELAAALADERAMRATAEAAAARSGGKGAGDVDERATEAEARVAAAEARATAAEAAAERARARLESLQDRHDVVTQEQARLYKEAAAAAERRVAAVEATATMRARAEAAEAEAARLREAGGQSRGDAGADAAAVVEAVAKARAELVTEREAAVATAVAETEQRLVTEREAAVAAAVAETEQRLALEREAAVAAAVAETEQRLALERETAVAAAVAEGEARFASLRESFRSQAKAAVSRAAQRAEVDASQRVAEVTERARAGMAKRQRAAAEKVAAAAAEIENMSADAHGIRQAAETVRRLAQRLRGAQTPAESAPTVGDGGRDSVQGEEERSVEEAVEGVVAPVPEAAGAGRGGGTDRTISGQEQVGTVQAPVGVDKVPPTRGEPAGEPGAQGRESDGGDPVLRAPDKATECGPGRGGNGGEEDGGGPALPEESTTEETDTPDTSLSTEESPAEAPPAQEPSTEESPAEAPPAQEPSTEESPAEAPPAQEPRAEEPPTDEPSVSKPRGLKKKKKGKSKKKR